ncbi:hypothetical protein C1X05_05675 [Laceyella sacchari]|nr:hypothetical protein C1X05_05675 [Laceyella sacchari]
MEFILGCVGLYTLIGMVYPSRWHRKLVIPLGKWRIDLGRRKWNSAIFILAVILSGIIGLSYTQLRYEQDKAMKMEARLRAVGERAGSKRRANRDATQTRGRFSGCVRGESNAGGDESRYIG